MHRCQLIVPMPVMSADSAHANDAQMSAGSAHANDAQMSADSAHASDVSW